MTRIRQKTSGKMTEDYEYKALSTEDSINIVSSPPTRQFHPNTSISWILITLNLLCHFITLVFTIHILYISFKDGPYLFAWHPSCLTIGFFGLMSNAIISQSKYNLWGFYLGPKHKLKVTIHWASQAAATVLISIGFFVIIINKNINNKNHFVTNHGLIGLISYCSVIAGCIGGVLTLYNQNFKQLISPYLLKIFHSVFGTLTYALTALCFVLGLYSHWYAKQNSEDLIRFSAVSVSFTLIVIILNLGYSNYKRIF